MGPNTKPRNTGTDFKEQVDRLFQLEETPEKEEEDGDKNSEEGDSSCS